MSLSEVDEYIREIEAAEKIKKNDGIFKKPYDKNNYGLEKEDLGKKRSMEQHKIKFNTNGYNSTLYESHQSETEKKQDATSFTHHNDTSFSSFDTEKFMTDFKAWTPSLHELSDGKISLAELRNFDGNEKFSNNQQKESNSQINEAVFQSYIPNSSDFTLENKMENAPTYLDANLISKFADEYTKSQTILSTVPEVCQTPITSSKSCPSIFKTPSIASVTNRADISNKKVEPSTVNSNSNSIDQTPVNTVNNNDGQNQRPQRFLTLSDFWNQDSSKSTEEMLRIKLEEERFRREHCEQMIQDLQKKLLEQQEKVAVAVRVDDEKNLLISQFQVQWRRIKQKVSELELERDSLQKVLKSISDKHQSEIVDYQNQIKKYKEEISQALSLATGFKDKSDSLVKEKLDLLKNHADEIQGFKLLVQQAENRYEGMKLECQKLLEKNQKSDEALKLVQQDLNKELLKSNDVRSEMTVIHKALDACEAELAILRQEKENLQLKLKEEVNRNSILEQGKNSLVNALDEAKKAEDSAKNEVKMLTEQQEKLRAELRDVYQKQVDEVVKAKLQEFQTQLDSAEAVFQNEIETKQRAIAECAARKIKSVIDKHQLEINLVEEKHKEEKRLFEIKVAQALQKAAILEAQLNSYRKSKNQLVEQLHSMMQKQWQQALLIITGSNGENVSTFPKIDVDKLFELPNAPKLELVTNHCNMVTSEPIKFESQKSTTNHHNIQSQEPPNESIVTITSHDETPLTSRKESRSDLKKYIKMILDMQQTKEDYTKPKFFNSPPSSQKENSTKQFSNKDVNTSNDGSSLWPQASELSIHDTSEYLSVPQKFNTRSDEHRQKPPWK